MRRWVIVVILIVYSQWVQATDTPPDYCPKIPGLLKIPCNRLHQIWYEGKNELYVPAYAWHNRYYYSSDKIGQYNENPWGAGLGKSYYDENRNWHGVYAFAFLDSHKNLEPFVGYAFSKMFHFDEKAAIGPGVAFAVTSRPDILHSIPFPGVLPLLSVNYQRASVTFVYIPGSHNVGNVLFFLARWVLN